MLKWRKCFSSFRRLTYDDSLLTFHITSHPCNITDLFILLQLVITPITYFLFPLLVIDIYKYKNICACTLIQSGVNSQVLALPEPIPCDLFARYPQIPPPVCAKYLQALVGFGSVISSNVWNTFSSHVHPMSHRLWDLSAGVHSYELYV